MPELTRCRNCSAPLAGEYCSHCGQREGRGDLRFSELAGEVLDELVSWDSRIWRTLLPLVFRPGFLTAEYFAGRRARYVPPVRLYLIISFVLFLVMSIFADYFVVSGHGGDVPVTGIGVTVDTAGRAAPPQAGDSVTEAPPPASTPAEHRDDRLVEIGLADDDSPRWLRELDRRIETNAGKLARDPGSYVELVFEYLPQMMFLLLPVFALLLRLCYLFSPYHYLQHLVFALHFHSFAFLLYLLRIALGAWLSVGIGRLFPLVLLLYLPLALMRAYGAGPASAVLKSLVILGVGSILLLASFVFITLLALALM